MDPFYLSNVRLSFPALIEPKAHTKPTAANPNPTKYYSCDALIAPTDPQWQEVWKQIMEVANTKWREHGAAVVEMCNNDRKMRSWGKGEEKINKKTMVPYDGYAGMLYISFNRNEKYGIPQMIRANGSAVDPNNTMEYQQLARALYGGCRVNIAGKFWPQDNENGRAIRCDLIAVQFAKDDEAFGEGTQDASTMFGAVQNAPQGATPAGAPLPSQTTSPFGQPTSAPAQGMPAAPFPAAEPKMPWE